MSLGQTYDERRQYDRAHAAYREAVRLNPRDPLAFFNAGLAFKKLKSYPEAIEMLRRAAELDPKNRMVLRQLAAVSAMELVRGTAN